MAERFHYRREHDHPLGWSVIDSKTGKAIAYGDKSIVATVADLLNGKPDPEMLKDLHKYF